VKRRNGDDLGSLNADTIRYSSRNGILGRIALPEFVIVGGERPAAREGFPDCSRFRKGGTHHPSGDLESRKIFTSFSNKLSTKKAGKQRASFHLTFVYAYSFLRGRENHLIQILPSSSRKNLIPINFNGVHIS
jgi:hypothetical protein